MGFLDNLLKREARKVLSTVVDSVVDDALQNLLGKDKNETVVSEASTNASVAAEESCGGEAALRRRIEQILEEEWKEFEVKKNVSSAIFAAKNGARATYDYGVYRDNVPVAMIMILRGNNEYRRKEVCLAREACVENGVAYMNFMSYMANRPSYISERFKNTIKA